MRWRSNPLPLLLLVLVLPQAASALQARPMSPSVVLVLKLVSADHVQPTTGIVISDDGLVLVPADFVSSEGEIIVLDGGTDIIKNGRPATIAQYPATGRLAVLSVKGLNRPGITLSGNAADKEPELHLTAFPPAELIAKGAPPLWVPVEIVTGEPDKQFSIAPETPQPYVFGPIMNGCGYLVGISSTSGPQSLQDGQQPINILANSLLRSLDQMQIELPTAQCEYKAPPVVEQSETVASSSKEASGNSTEADLIKPEVYRPAIRRKRLNPFQGALPPPGTTQGQERPSVWRSVPFWVPLLSLIILGALVWKGIFFFRLTKNRKGQTTDRRTGSHVQPASDEPDTAPLNDGSYGSKAYPRSVPVEDLDIPEIGTRPEGCDAVLVVEGLMDSDTTFKRFCFVNTEQINIVIGRTDADINIEHPAISRRHVRIESSRDLLTLTDLGSSNGTAVRDIPCLPEEVVYIEAGDEIYLGDVLCKINVIKQEAEWA